MEIRSTAEAEIDTIGYSEDLFDMPERSWWQRHGPRIITNFGRVLLLVVLLIAWQLSAGKLVSLLFVSKPSLIWHQLVAWSNSGVLWSNTWVTIEEIIIGFVAGAVTGVLFGFLLATQRTISSVLDPFIMSLYAIPKVALAPLFIVWFGIGLEMKVVLAAITVFFLVFLNTAAGIKEVDEELINAARLMCATKRDLLWKVVIPGSMSGVLTGLRISIPYALIGAVIGELVASNHGLGYLINDSASSFNTAGVFAALVVLTVIAAILNWLVNRLGSYTQRWKPTDEGI